MKLLPPLWLLLFREKDLTFCSKTTLAGVIDEIITPVVAPFIQRERSDILQQNNACYFYFRPLYRKNELNAYIFCLFCENSSISKRCLVKYSEKVIVYLMFSFYL